MKGKDSKKTPREEIREKSLDFADPFMLIDVLGESNIGRVLQALKGLKEFVRKNKIKDLLNSAILDKILILIQDKRSGVDVIEFSLELLSQLLLFSKVIHKISEEEEFILLLYSYIKTKPLDVQVQCLQCFAILTSVKSIQQLLFLNSDLNLLFQRLGQKDPDVHASILKIIHNLVESDIAIAEKIVNLPGFSYMPFIQLLTSDYPIVQHRALDLIILITSYNHINILKIIFLEENGISALVKILETHQWPDLHHKIFTILNNVGCLNETFSKLGEAGIKMLIFYVDEIESQKLQFTAFQNILNIVEKSDYGLNLFVEYGLTELVIKHLNGESESNMFKLAIRGMAILSANSMAMSALEENPDIILTMFEVISSIKSTYNWTVRYNALTAIHLMSKTEVFLDTLMDHQKWEIILELLDKNSGIAPYNMLLLLAIIFREIVARVFDTIPCPSKTCNKLIRVLKHLVTDPLSKRVELKCVSCEIIEQLLEFPQFRELLKEKKVYRVLSKLIFRVGENLTIMEAYLKLFIHLIEWDSSFIDDLTYIQAINWFIEKKDIHRALPVARRFLDLIFDKCKYIKLHFTNRLEMWDKMEGGFYVQRGIPDYNNFQSLKVYIREKYMKSRPIYYVNYEGSDSCFFGVRRVTDRSIFSCLDEVSLYTTEDDECFMDDWGVLKDPHLKIELKKLKLLLGYSSQQKIPLKLCDVLNREEYIKRIQILSDYVCNLTSQEDEDEECDKHCFELHLAELKANFGVPIVPIGYLKEGTKFERALLFKALGDQVGIPSAFVRAHCGSGWNEVYLPPIKRAKEESVQWINLSDQTLNRKISLKRSESALTRERTMSGRAPSLTRKSKTDRKQSRKSLGRSKSTVEDVEEPVLPPFWYHHAYQAYMKTNHILDLTDRPGQLYPIGSVEAEDYTCQPGPIHPYFWEKTLLPPLIKSSTIQPPENQQGVK